MNKYVRIVMGAILMIAGVFYFLRVILRIEDITPLEFMQGKSQGFVSWNVEALSSLSQKDKLKFIPSLIDDASLEMYRRFWA